MHFKLSHLLLSCLLRLYRCAPDIRSPERIRKTVNYTGASERVVAIPKVLVIHYVLIIWQPHSEFIIIVASTFSLSLATSNVENFTADAGKHIDQYFRHFNLYESQ